MVSNSRVVSEPLPQEMQAHTYSIMNEVEQAHWWFVGRRRIIESFLKRLSQQMAGENPTKTPGSTQSLKILDVGCGTGANLEMLSQFGEAEGVDVSAEALDFCRARG